MLLAGSSRYTVMTGGCVLSVKSATAGLMRPQEARVDHEGTPSPRGGKILSGIWRPDSTSPPVHHVTDDTMWPILDAARDQKAS
jgi:hypothetical protein